MYFILSVTEKSGVPEFSIINHITGRKQALQLLEQVCREYISDQAGRPWAQFVKIIDVENLNKIESPVDDGLYMVRLISNPDRIDIYKRFTKTIKGIIYNSYDSGFRKERSFELVQYDKLSGFG